MPTSSRRRVGSRRTIGAQGSVAAADTGARDSVYPALSLIYMQPKVHRLAFSQAFQFRSRADFERHCHRVHVVGNGLMLNDETVALRPKFTNDSPRLENLRGV